MRRLSRPGEGGRVLAHHADRRAWAPRSWACRSSAARPTTSGRRGLPATTAACSPARETSLTGIRRGVFQVRFPRRSENLHLEDRAHGQGSRAWRNSARAAPTIREAQPAATLTFEVLWYLPKLETLILTLNSRGGVTAAKKLFTLIDAKRADHYYQRYTICRGLR